MPAKNSTGTGKAEGKSGTVKKPRKLAVKKETIAKGGVDGGVPGTLNTLWVTCGATCGCPRLV